MTSNRSLIGKAALLGGLAFAALGTAQARDVYWSVGVHAAPGVHVGVGNHRPAPPVVVAPAPVIVPQVAYTSPPVIYTQPQVVYPGGIYYAQPAPVVVYRNGWTRSQWDGPRHHKHGGHWRGHGGRGHGHGHGHDNWR